MNLQFGLGPVVAWAASECGLRGVPESTLRDACYLVGKVAAAGGTEREARAAVTELLDLRHGRRPSPPRMQRWDREAGE